MATNPITSDDLTIDFQSLLEIPVSERVQAAALDTGFSQALIASLTPIQMAKAFPDYYRKELPDISNFILANRYLDKGGAFDQKGGGDYGSAKPLYGGESSTNAGVTPTLPKTVVDKILESAKIQEAMGQQGITSSLKDVDENKIVSTETVSISPGERALLDTIAIGNPNKEGFWESPDYNTIVGRGGKFTDYSDHPRVFGTASSTAAGRYQFTKTTWDDVVSRFNKQNPDKPITDFTPVNQDRAALFLARERYKANTGRDLDADLQNPPENMGDLIREGLGQGRKFMTWEIFTKRTSDEIGEAFNENLARNREFAKQEAEAAAKNEKLDNIIVTPELQAELDKNPEAKQYFTDHPDMAKKLQKSINDGNLSVDNIKTIVETPTEATSVLSKVEKQKFVSEKDPRQFYQGNKAVEPDDEIWNHVHPDLARDRDRIYAGGGKIRTGAILAADASFRYAASKGIPMRVAVEGGVDSHSSNHLNDGVGEALDIKPGTRDAQGRDVGSANTWEEYKLDPLEIATIGAATIQSMGGTARIGVTNDFHGTHLQDTGGEGLGIHEQYGGMSWSYGGDPHGAGRGGDFRNKLQSGYFGQQYAGVVDSLYEPEKKKEESTPVPTATEVKTPEQTPTNITAAEEEIVKTQTAEYTPGPEEAPKFRTGGSPETQDDENLSVYDEDGNIRWKMNSGEGIYVKPESNEYADNKIEELSGRVDEMDERMSNQPQEKKSATDKIPNKPEKNWQQHIANMVYSPGTQGRAFKRSKFQNEGFHFGRGSPNSTTS